MLARDGGNARAGQDDAGQVQRVGGADADRLAGVMRLPDRPEDVERIRVGVLLAAETGHEAAAADGAPGFHPPERPEQVTPGNRKVLPGCHVAEYHAPPGGELLGDGLGELVAVRTGGRLRQQRPAAGGARGVAQAAAQPARRGVAGSGLPRRSSDRTARNPSAVTSPRATASQSASSTS